MSQLTLDLFVNTQRDYESRQFHILGELQKVRKGFAQNKIYPSLSELIELYHTLRKIAAQAGDIRLAMPGRIVGLDLDEKRVIYEPHEMSNDDLREVEELINWSLPYIQHAVEEGQTIYNFVDEHLRLAEVGLLPSYVEEGYLLVPDMGQNLLHVFRYEVSIFTGPDQRYRNLKTTGLKTMPLSLIAAAPWSLKEALIREYQELPNPATYIFSTDIEFPFAETVLPVAKRKLLRQIYS
jgi:hypothetical protein